MDVSESERESVKRIEEVHLSTQRTQNKWITMEEEG